MLIFKEALPTDTYAQIVRLPYPDAKAARSAILHLDMQHGYPCMWYNADSLAEKRNYLIIAVGTGRDAGYELDSNDYIGSCLLLGGSLVLHYFLIET